ncbi:MAG: hypothetical protein ACRDXX_12400 [Stackebrandtia sp.]
MTVSDDAIMAKAQAVQKKALEQIMKEMTADAISPIPSDMSKYKSMLDLSWISNSFAWFTERDPGDFATMAESARQLKKDLDGGMVGMMNGVRSDLGDWQGNASAKFGEFLLDPFPDVHRNQLAMADELILASDGMRQMLEDSRDVIVDVGDKTVAALAALDKGGDIFSVLLKAGVAALVAVVGGLATGATGGLGALALVNFAGSAASSGIDQANIGGETVSDVLSKMNQTIAAAQENMTEAENAIRDALEQDVSTMTQSADHFKTKRPGVADDVDLGKFRPPEHVYS